MIAPRPAGRLSRCILVALPLALPFLLAACFGKTSAEDLACPDIAPAQGLENIAIFGAGPDRSAQNVRVLGKIAGTARRCETEKGGILVNAVITFTAGRTSPQVKHADFPYFVAVVDINQKILNEQRFTVPVDFVGSDFRSVQEKISVHLPLQRVSAGRNFAVLVGFQLSPEQIQFNRSQTVGQ
jgi:hypothetical protein